MTEIELETEEASKSMPRFVERFGDYFDGGMQTSIAFGLMFAWIWMGLTEGFPIFTDGLVDLPSVMILLFSFAAALFAFGYLRAFDFLLCRPAAWMVASVLMSVISLLMFVVFRDSQSAPATYLPVVRFLMVFLGIGGAAIIQCCAVAFSRLRFESASIGLVCSVAFMFAVYFCLMACAGFVRGALFCVLPACAAAALFSSRRSLVQRLAIWPEEQPCSMGRGFKVMSLSFGVYYFAIGAKCVMEPVSDFAVGADTSVVALLLCALLFLYLIAFKVKQVSAFRALKAMFETSVILLTVCVAAAPLSFEPYVSILFNADVAVLTMALWLLVAYVAHFNEAYVCKVVAVALGVSALGMALGWLAGSYFYFEFGHSRSYPTLAIAFATALFTAVGLSLENFSHLTKQSEAALRLSAMQVSGAPPIEPVDYSALAAEKFGLSEREAEVLALLSVGFGAEAVSDKLVISYHTARTHVRNIYKKMGVHSQRELLEYFEDLRAARRQSCQLDGEEA